MRRIIPFIFLSILFFTVACEDGNFDSRTQYIKTHENRFEVDTVFTDSKVYEFFSDTTLIDFEEEL